ncbi:hypothetical protein LF817_03805 [Halobacillus sp. A1]|uniref:hypothetical protein n=1 Tax=Halobacillus sp. A1 TaxID=2880262 RepID=UPI0020A66D29|nr:hypothetical protein [Halobacillus sp. A1]MCP3030458.1 hypothetical protein [Halobacillus sp. A1]
MAEKNKIVISFNRDQEQTKKEIVQAQEEQAASQIKKVHHIHEIKRQPKFSKFTAVKNNVNPSYMKHVSISIMTAIVVSVFLGFILLKLFVSVTEESAPAAESLTEGSKAEVTSAAQVPVKLPELETQVVQSGVFTSEETALEWQKDLSDKSLPSLIWKQSDQYFLLSGTSDLDDGIQSLSGELTKLDVPTYIKNWNVPAADLMITENNAAVAETIITHLENNTLHTVPVEERKALLEKWDDSAAGEEKVRKAFDGWVNEQANGLTWLEFAKAFESL